MIGHERRETAAARQALATACLLFAVVLCAAPLRAEDAGASAPKLVKQGNQLLTQKKYDEALTKYEAAADDRPDAAEIAYNRGIALYKLDRFDEAEGALQNAIKPSNPELEARAKYNLGRCAQAAGLAKAAEDEQAAINELTRAVRFYDDALALDPDDASAQGNKSVAERQIRYLEKRLEQKKKQEKKEKEQDSPSSQPSSQPTSQPSPSSQPTSQPDQQPTSQPQKSDGGEKQDQDQQDGQQQQDPQDQDQQNQDQKQDQQGNEGQENEQEGDEKQSQSTGEGEKREMTPEEAERFLQQARDAERDRREQRRQRAMRLRGRVRVERDW